MSVFQKFSDRLHQERDGAGLACLRVIVAGAVLCDIARLFLTDEFSARFLEPDFFFKYPLAAFVPSMHGLMPYGFFVLLSIVALAVLVGWKTAAASKVLFIGVLYWFLIDASAYSDHFYLLVIGTLLAAWLPVNRWISSDRFLGREPRTAVPGWTVALVRAQLLLVFVFSGIAQLNSDWLAGAPMAEWAAEQPVESWQHAFASRIDLLQTAAWAGALFDLAIGFGLWWRITRIPALIALVLFQAADAIWFHVGPSPILLALLAVVFCEPARVRSIGDRIIAGIARTPLARPVGRLLCGIGRIADRAVSWFDDTPVFGKTPPPAATPRKRTDKPAPEPTGFSPWQQYAVAAWLLVQVIVPLRASFSRENPAWTGAGSTFAWRGDRIDKQSRLHMGAIQSSRQMRWPIDPTDDFPVPLAILFTPEEMQQRQLTEGALRDLLHSSETMLPVRLKEHGFDDRERDNLFRRAERLSQTHLSRAQFALVSQRADLVWQYAQYAATVLNQVLGERMPVEAELQFSLNNRPWEVCLSDGLDLTKIPGPTELSSRLHRLSKPLPPAAERVELAEAMAADRRATEGYDMGTRRPPEPVKAPPLTDDDDDWIREHFPERSASRTEAK